MLKKKEVREWLYANKSYVITVISFVCFMKVSASAAMRSESCVQGTTVPYIFAHAHNRLHTNIRVLHQL